MAGFRNHSHRARWLFLSILFVLLFSRPLLQIFNRNIQVLGIPLLVLYLLLAWIGFIGIIYRFSRRIDGKAGTENSRRKGERLRS